MVERTDGTRIKMKTILNRKSQIVNRAAFTLIELLVVISIIGVLAAFTIPVLTSVKSNQYKKVARGELELIETALENYKAKYGAYPPGNAIAASATYKPALLPQLYYELSGTVLTKVGSSICFQTLDGSADITNSPSNDVMGSFGVGGFLNCSKGGGEDGNAAKNFLVSLSSKNIGLNSANLRLLVTSVGGPDDKYHPLDPSGGTGPNPFRYVYPGVNNPNGYDLWVQLVIKGQTNLICNWSRQVIINSSLP